MNNYCLVLQITVITVIFLRVSIFFIIYITIYILISYKAFKRGCTPSFFNCNNCNCNSCGRFYLFLYQALESFVKFEEHLERVALDAHIRRQRAEVRLERAVRTTRNGDVLASEDARVALRRPGHGLDERVVRVAAAEIIDVGIMIAAQHALIIPSGPHRAVAVKNGLNVTT